MKHALKQPRLPIFSKNNASNGTLTTKIIDFLKKTTFHVEQKSKILNILEKTTFHVEHTPKKHSLAHHFACHCKKIIIYGGYFCRFFVSRETSRCFWRYIAFFGNFKPLKNICLPVFWLFHVKHRLFFRYYVIFLIVGLFLSVFVVFLA